MSDIYDLIIIGGGPAGLTSSIYSTRAGYNTLLIEKIGFGGQMMLSDIIENYPGFPDGITGFELQERMVGQAKKFGLKNEIVSVKKIEKNDDFFNVITDKNAYRSLSVIIATGAKHRKLNIPGEKEFASRGVSYCGTCDGPFFKDRSIVVIGGGDTAITEALFLAKFAKSITIVHRKSRFRAVKSLVNQADKIEKINYIFNSIVTEIKGDNSVGSVIIKNIQTNDLNEEKVDGVFVFVGIIPNTEFVDKRVLDENNYVITDSITMATKINGLYAAGDVKSGAFKQIICASADGATAAEYAGKYIDELKGNTYK